MKATVIRTDDWVQLWLPKGEGRELAAEGHSLDYYDVLDALGIEYESHEFDKWYQGIDERNAVLERGGSLEEAVAASEAAEPSVLDEDF